MARLVVHIDDHAIAAVGQVFREFIPPNSMVLDLMSSWRSHWPSGHPKQRMAGLGLNAVEMQDNPDLDQYVVHDVNREPELPFEDETFDAVVITVSAQYLTRPVSTFQEVNRILKPSGVFIVTFSNRMFPTKAVRIWRASSDRGRMEVVASYMDQAGNFEEIRGGFANPDESPPGDPIFMVIAKKASDSLV
jgi:SAM-dependent methyltransferase